MTSRRVISYFFIYFNGICDYNNVGWIKKVITLIYCVIHVFMWPANDQCGLKENVP